MEKSGCVMFYLCCVFCACYLDAGHISLFLSAMVQVSGPGCVTAGSLFIQRRTLAAARG